MSTSRFAQEVDEDLAQLTPEQRAEADRILTALIEADPPLSFDGTLEEMDFWQQEADKHLSEVTDEQWAMGYRALKELT